jgi:hypothetical protein
MPSPKSASPKRKSKSPKRNSKSAAAPAAAAGAAAPAGGIRDYAIADPPMKRLSQIPRASKGIPTHLKGHYKFYRDPHTTPNWIYFTTEIGENLTEEIVGVYNTDTSKEYTIRGGLITPSSEAFGFMNTTLNNTRLKNRGGGQKTRRRQTRRS